MHLFVNYNSYKEPLLNSGLMTHELLKEKISTITNQKKIEVKIAGYSAQHREIYQLSVGRGPIPVMLWSQMHGDEPTGTRAFFDLFNFLQADDEHNDFRQLIFNHCTLHFIPMLNPDGAELNERRNAQGIDINRDFLQQQSPEAQLLTRLHQQIQPAFGFNMHDQEALWSVAGTKQPASISLLAPPADDLALVSPSRLKAMQLVAGINGILSSIIPGYVGKWSETFEPHAFGDNFQRLGTSTLLIEAGGYPGDAERQFVRELNFKILLYALEQITTAGYQHHSITAYHQIPQNVKELFHLLIKNVILPTPAGIIRVDIGLNHSHSFDAVPLQHQALYAIQDIGDLSTYNAYQTIDVQGYEFAHALSLGSLANFTVIDALNNTYSFQNGQLFFIRKT
ncbi:M14 family zinc carboxypeptidase [Mucilaginibacter sp. CSA2-8R]|uniref:M14 family zinc carboxypeptidase n=1 Tax=Mucilaginibacter sp. CSA2-8R TaxID=3141542 RepID=UPI00315D2C1D